MIKVKHFLEAAEPDDGQRLWVEPIGLTKELVEWCKVDHVLSHLGPPKAVWEWFEEHPDGYDCFRGEYHEALSRGPHKEALKQMACAALRENFTLLHQGTDAQQNTGVALHEFLVELEAWCPPETT